MIEYKVAQPVIVVMIFLWIGFVCAISFMESWLKFKAPGVTLHLGLGIGKRIFSALNKVELILAAIIIGILIYAEQELFSIEIVSFYIPFLILVVQTFWLLPQLNTRADLYNFMEEIPSSKLHFYYVGIETVKVICLIIFGALQFDSI